MSGRFITFEGPDGSGKSTQASLLADRLKAVGVDCVLTREPGGTPVGEAIRNILQYDSVGDGMNPLTEIFLFEASRSALVNSLIIPALEDGKWVICDRFADSTTVYQGYGRDYDLKTLNLLNSAAVQGLDPDVTVVLDVAVDDGFARLEKRNKESGSEMDRMEREEKAFHERVRKGYLEIADKYPDRCKVLNGSGDVEKVAEEIWGVISNRFSAELS